MSKNGGEQKKRERYHIDVDPRNLRILEMGLPQNPAVALTVLQNSIASLFQHVANEQQKEDEPERKVKTLDEMGVQPRFRLM